MGKDPREITNHVMKLDMPVGIRKHPPHPHWIVTFWGIRTYSLPIKDFMDVSNRWHRPALSLPSVYRSSLTLTPQPTFPNGLHNMSAETEDRLF